MNYRTVLKIYMVCWVICTTLAIVATVTAQWSAYMFFTLCMLLLSTLALIKFALKDFK